MRDFFVAFEIVHFVYTTLVILAGCGVVVGADKDWSGSAPQKVVTVVKEVPVEKVVEKIVTVQADIPPAPPAESLPMIEWSQEFLDLEELKADVVADSGPLRWIIESNDGCAYCVQNWNTLRNDKEMQREGWAFGPGGHFQKEDVRWDHPIPAWKLMQGETEIERRVGTQSGMSLKTRYLEEFNKAQLASKALPAKSIDAGTISREQVELVLSFIGRAGTYRGGNVKRSIPVSGITAELPANLGADWTTDATGNLRVKLTPSASGRWGLVSLSVSGLVYDGKTITIQTPFSLMNPVLTVK